MILEIVVIFLIFVVLKVFCKLTAGRCKSPVCLIGKTVLITGGNSGIGFQAALALAGRGCRLIIADKDDCEESKEKIIQETGNSNIVIKKFDLASLSSVRRLAKDINDSEERLDILINNAGTIGSGHYYTEDGLHIGTQVNHFGPFLLTHLLVGLLRKSAPSRIIFVSSIAAYWANLTVKTLNFPERQSTNPFSELNQYANSKLCTVITAREFAKKLKGAGVTSNALHPGLVFTPIGEKFSYCFGNNRLKELLLNIAMRWPALFLIKDAEEGAQTTIHLALAKELEKVTGKYFIDCQPFRIPGPAKDQNFSSEIWKSSEGYVKLAPEEKL